MTSIDDRHSKHQIVPHPCLYFRHFRSSPTVHNPHFDQIVSEWCICSLKPCLLNLNYLFSWFMLWAVGTLSDTQPGPLFTFLSAFWSTVRKFKHASSAAERNEEASHSSDQSSNVSDLNITHPIIYSKTTYLLYLNWFMKQLHIIDNRKIVLENNYRFPTSQLFG